MLRSLFHRLIDRHEEREASRLLNEAVEGSRDASRKVLRAAMDNVENAGYAALTLRATLDALEAHNNARNAHS